MLLSYCLTPKILPEKYDTKNNPEPIWINPILNAPITMSIEKSNFKNILLSSDEFLDCFIDETCFNVGLFKRNTVYHTYYLETDKLFKDISQSGSKLQTHLFKKLSTKLSERKSIDDFQNTLDYIQRVNSEIHILQNIHPELKEIEIVSNLNQFVERLSEIEKIKSKFDFVFYPFLSAASHFDNNINYFLQEFRNNHSIEIYPIPRIMTPKGWRFTFPPKFLNHNTFGKNVLILDDGSCSGETIIQMIDSISFLEVREITVLSVFARLEDYNREFLSRINVVKVKSHSIPVNVYFGTHFNIPIYNKSNNPYVIELNDLEKIENDKKEIPSTVKNYLEFRKKQINNYPTYFLTDYFQAIEFQFFH